MKKNFYKIIMTLALIFTLAASQAQVNVTYKVDITQWLAGGGVLAAGGMRVGGNFTSTGAPAVADWTPSSPTCAMTDLGNNVWSITISYDDTAVGNVQQWKYVNGDWGGDEGQAGTTMLDSTCGIGNGFGGFNRDINVPEVNSVYLANFDQCGTLTATGISVINASAAALDVYPNPAVNYTQISYVLNTHDNVSLTLRSFTGQVLETLVNKVQTPGAYSFGLNTNDLANGIYFMQINVGGVSANKRFVVNR